MTNADNRGRPDHPGHLASPHQVADWLRQLARFSAEMESDLAEAYERLHVDAHRRPRWDDPGGGGSSPGAGRPTETAWAASQRLRANLVDAGEAAKRALASLLGVRAALDRADRALADAQPESFSPASERQYPRTVEASELAEARRAQRRRAARARDATLPWSRTETEGA